MNSLQFLSHLIELYGLYAVFFLAMIEGDITLLLAGVLAHNDFFGSYSFARVVSFAISQPAEVDINEILFRPTAQEL